MLNTDGSGWVSLGYSFSVITFFRLLSIAKTIKLCGLALAFAAAVSQRDLLLVLRGGLSAFFFLTVSASVGLRVSHILSLSLSVHSIS